MTFVSHGTCFIEYIIDDTQYSWGGYFIGLSIVIIELNMFDYINEPRGIFNPIRHIIVSLPTITKLVTMVTIHKRCQFQQLNMNEEKLCFPKNGMK